MPDWLAGRAEIDPDHPALIFERETLSYRSLDARARRAAARFASLGIRPGDRVAVLGGNRPETVIAIHALPKIGAVLVPVNCRLAEDEIIWQLGNCDARLLLHGPERAGAATRAASVLGRLSCAALAPAPPEDENLPDAGIAARASHNPSPESLHAIIYTSGTSGRPKGAMLTYGNHLASATGFARRLGTHPDDRWLLCMPLYHVGGLAILLRATLSGATVVLQDRFDPARVLEAVDAHRITLLSVVPVMLQRMYEVDPDCTDGLPPLRCVLLGGGPAPRGLLDDSLRRRVPVAVTYGLTECASQVATLLPRELARNAGSVGQPLEGLDLRIERDDGTPAKPGEAGEICVRGPVVMRGYRDLPDETAHALRGGWLHTGDVGCVDPRGYLTVMDRRKNLVISGGENVYPAEVERVLLQHPGVLEAAVIGRPDARWGGCVVGVVVPRPGSTPDETALIAHCRGLLAAYKAPRRVLFVDRLPRSSLGKVSYREVSKLFERAKAPGV